MDNLTKKQRSFAMSQVKSKNTSLELDFRKFIWSKGARGYRIKSKLPGNPDLFFPRKRVAVFIDGCFWHKCPKCFQEPKSNVKYWSAKLNRNLARDIKVNCTLRDQNVIVLRFWEHEVRNNLPLCFEKIRAFL